MNNNGFAQATTIRVIQLHHTLFLRVEGFKPTPCHEVWLERSKLTVEPPTFLLMQAIRLPPGHECEQMVVAFRTDLTVPVGNHSVDEVIVRDQSGDHLIKVEQVRHPKPPPAAAKGDAQFCVREAYGYSPTFSLAEAINHALQDMPPNEAAKRFVGRSQAPAGPNQAPAGPNQAPAGPNQAPAGPNQAPAGPNQAPAGPNQAPAGPNQAPAGGGSEVGLINDELTYYEVVSIGVEIGGFAGLHHLKVLLRAYDLRGITEGDRQHESIDEAAQAARDTAQRRK